MMKLPSPDGKPTKTEAKTGYQSNSRQSLLRQTLLATTLGIGTVILVATGIGYFRIVSQTTNEKLAEVEKYVQLRVEREKATFELAEKNQNVLRADFVKQMKALGDSDPSAKFEQLFVRMPDGTVRNRPSTFDVQKIPGLFLGPKVEVNADIQRRSVVLFELLSAYGPAWRDQFLNTFVKLPENGIAIYMPSYAYAQSAPASESLTSHESFFITDKATNPKRDIVWTGIYYDDVARAWMASCVTPVDIDGKHVATLGHDILIGALRERTIQETLPGTYNMIFREDGRLVAHPKLTDAIQEAGGDLNISQAQDPHLREIFDIAVNSKDQNQIIRDNPNYDEYIAVTKIPGPDWYFITVLPKKIIQKSAFQTASLLLILGLSALLIEILVLYLILRRQVSQPLNELMEATEVIAAGNLDVRVDDSRTDELGRLATLFNNMTYQLRESFAALEQTNAELQRKNEQIAQESQLLQEDVSQILEVVTEAEDGDLTVQSSVSDRVTGLVSDTLNRLLEQLARIIGSVQAQTQQTSENAVEMEQLTISTTQLARQQAEVVNQIRGLIASITDLSQSTAQQAHVTDTAVHQMQLAVSAGNQEMESMTEGITTLRQGTEQIIQRVQTLTDYVSLTTQFSQAQKRVATMTRVLALNASMLAARATGQEDPEQFASIGREFETIALQVNELATQTNQSLILLQQRTDQIQTVVSGLNYDVQAISQIVVNFSTGAEQSRQVFDRMSVITNQVAQLGEDVAQASQEIAEAAQTTLQAMQSITDTAVNVEHQASLTREQARVVGAAASTLLEMVSFFHLPSESNQNGSSNVIPAENQPYQTQLPSPLSDPEPSHSLLPTI